MRVEIVPIRCRIPIILKSLGKDQQWLADVSEKSRQSISDYCHMRKVMNLRTAALLSYYLNCDIDDLYDWEWQKK